MARRILLPPLCVFVTCYAATFIFTLFSVVSQSSTPMRCTSTGPNMHQHNHREYFEETVNFYVAIPGIFPQEYVVKLQITTYTIR